MRFLLSLCTLLLLALPAPGQAELKATLESTYVVVGEVTRLTVYIASPQAPNEKPQVPAVAEVSIRLGNEGRRDIRQNGKRELVHIYQYLVQSFEEGRHTIPPFEVTIGNQSYRSQAVDIHVKPADAIEWQTYRVGQEDLRYGSAVFTPDRQPFVGETFPAEAKLYLPVNIVVAERGMAELEHDGLTAWRFEPSKTSGRASLPLGTYNAFTFRSTASAIREGKTTLGPGRARLGLQTTSSARGFRRWTNTPVALPLSATEITARPLPPGAPADFRGAVGRFTVGMSAEVENLEEGDPIAVKLSVSGIGNLDSLQPPAPIADAADWKAYDPSRLERQGERRDIAGRVLFSQIIRPLTEQKVIPPFQLAFFDPLSEEYRTVATQPLPFKVIPSKTPVLTGPVVTAADNAVRNMQGILGVVDPLRRTREPGALLRYWQLVPAALAAFLLALVMRRRWRGRQTRPTHTREIQQALASVEKSDPHRREFLRAAGHFIEAWIPAEDRDEELQAILERRDRECFRPPESTEVLPQKERSQLLQTLRTKALAAVSLLVLFLIAGTGLGASTGELYDQARAAWEEERYHSALALYTEAHPEGDFPADVEFNLGNCHYRLGEPGMAALHYHRALQKDPRHREAAQNLSYLENEQGIIARVTPDNFAQKLVFWSSSTYRELTLGGLWLGALASLALIAFSSVTIRVLAWITLPLALLGTTYCALMYFGLTQTDAVVPLNPLDHPEQISLVTTSTPGIARTEPRESAPSVISAPPGTPALRLADRGAWIYLEFADLSRGWLPSTVLTPLLPAPPESAEREAVTTL